MVKAFVFVLLTFALAAVAGALEFANREPRHSFVADCVARSSYSHAADAIDRCNEELRELQLDQKLGTAFAVVATLVLVPTLVVLVIVAIAWLPVVFGRSR